MKIEIWSDVMCPFCYIGKRKLEQALAKWDGAGQVEISWRSFLLDPDLQPRPGLGVVAYLAERKGQSMAWSEQAHAQVTAMAQRVGLTYNFDKAVVANSFDAHQVLQLAKVHGRDGEMEERLFSAYFTEGADIGDHGTLLRLAEEVGLGRAEAQEALSSGRYAEQVRMDHALAGELGARGVPFFVIDQRYGIMGAQEPEAFLQVFEKASKAGTAS